MKIGTFIIHSSRSKVFINKNEVVTKITEFLFENVRNEKVADSSFVDGGIEKKEGVFNVVLQLLKNLRFDDLTFAVDNYLLICFLFFFSGCLQKYLSS